RQTPLARLGLLSLGFLARHGLDSQGQLFLSAQHPQLERLSHRLAQNEQIERGQLLAKAGGDRRAVQLEDDIARLEPGCFGCPPELAGWRAASWPIHFTREPTSSPSSVNRPARARGSIMSLLATMPSVTE